jgi:hypothetical protein
MHTAVSPTRPDHDTSPRRKAAASTCAAVTKLCLAALAGYAGMAAFAQGGVPCTAIVDDAERLACYDKALRPAPPTAPAATPAPVAPAATPPAAAPRAATREVATPSPTSERREERRVRESATSAPPAAPAAPPAAPAAPTASRAGASDDEAVVPIVIVSMRALPGREATFTAEDGTSWVQTDGQRLIGLPDPPFAAELKPGTMGSVFLVPAERGRAIRVRRVR